MNFKISECNTRRLFGKQKKACFLGESMIQKISFESDCFLLQGDLHIPPCENPPTVIGSHGLFADRRSPKQVALAQACNAAAMAYFRFDYRGCGDSDGGPEDQCSFEGRCQDLIQACETIRQRKGCGEKIALFGSSLGGAAACRVSHAVGPSSIAIFAAPANSRCIFDAVERVEGRDKYPPYFYENLYFDNGDFLPGLSDILVFHGDADEVVPVSEGRKIYEAAKGPKKLIVQEHGDHRMSGEIHQREFVRVAVNWFKHGFERK